MSWTKNTLILSASIIGGALIYSHKSPPPKVNLDHLADQFVDAGFQLKDTNPLPDQMRTIIITTDINAQCSQQVIKKLLYLNQLSSKKVIKLYLRTEGGWEADAYSIIDIMQSIEAPVEVHAMGDVFSSGLMILAAATGKRYIYENTLLGFHALEQDETALVAKRYNDFWEKYTALPKSLTSLSNGEMEYLSGEQALKYKIADEIIEK